MGREMGCNISGDVDDSKFSNPLPWIGIYVAVASLSLSLVMIKDIIRCLRYKCYCFPIKFCSLNATVLTLLTTSIKLSLDLDTPMPRSQDQLTKLSSTVLVCTVIANSMPSIGIMQDQEIFMNITALGILVINLIVNICIQLATGVIYVFWVEHILVMFFMLVLLIILSLTATAVPTTKHYIKQKYSKQHQLTLQKRWDENDRCELQKAKEDLTKYRMMGYTGAPRVVMARSVTTSASGVICLLTALILGEAMLRSFIMMPGSIDFCHGESSYKWSTTIVLITHTIAVAVGTIAPSSRYFMTITSGQFGRRKKSFKEEVKVESYWVDQLLKWKEEPLGLRIRRRRWRKFANETKWRLLDICIRGQRTIVVLSKVVCLTSVVCLNRLLVCRCWFKNLIMTRNGSRISRNGSSESASNTSAELDFSDYILYLEGEEELVKHMARNGSNCFSGLGRRQQPTHLMQLLEKCTCFQPTIPQSGRFNSYRIACLLLEESPVCWALPVVTLTSIAAALPEINHQVIQQLIHAVDEGLVHVRRVESSLYMTGETLNPNVRKAAEIVWLGVDLYNKWFDVGLSDMARQSCNHRDVIEGLSHLAEGRLAEHNNNNNKSKNTDDGLSKENPPLMPAEIIAASSMHTISRTIMLNYEKRNYQSNEELFQELSSIIAYIMGACLRSLPEVLLMECSASSMENNPMIQRDALLILSKMENILKFLQQKPLPTWDRDEMAFVGHLQLSGDSCLQSQSSFSGNCSETTTSSDLCLSAQWKEEEN